MATTVYIPLQLSTVNLANANAFWTAVDGTNFDYGVFSYIHKSTGTLVFEGIIPQNVATATLGTVSVIGTGTAGTSGTSVLTVQGI